MIFFYRCKTHGRFIITEDREFDDMSAYACAMCASICERVPMPTTRSHVGLKIKKGRFFSTAFGKEFMNETEELAFARDHGHIPVGDEDPNQVAKRMDEKLSENLDQEYPDYQERVELTTQ